MRRVKKKQRKNGDSCPLSPGVVSFSAEPSPVKGHSKKLPTEELNKENADRDWIELCKCVEKYDFENNEVEPQDFEGEFERDTQSALRKRIKRIKVSETDPIILGRILARTGNKRVPFVSDTGCSVNIIPACFAAVAGLKWRDVDSDESTFRVRRTMN